MQLFSRGKNGYQHGSRARALIDEDVAQHGGDPTNTKSCSLGLQHVSLILDIQIMVN